MNNEIFKKSCLLQLTTSVYCGQKMIAPIIMEQLGDSTWLKGRKVLIDPKYLKPIKAITAQTRITIKKNSLPFPIAGLNLVPKQAIQEIEESLKRKQTQFLHCVADFKAQ